MLTEIVRSAGEQHLLPRPIDSKSLSLMDFLGTSRHENLTLEQRFNEMNEFIEDGIRCHHYLYQRVSLDGSGPRIRLKDQYSDGIINTLNFATNDYLNLTKHPDVVSAAAEATKRYGVGAGSVPMLAGTTDLHKTLAERISALKGCEDALLFTSGFGMNYGVLSALLKKNDLAILDCFVHASILDGCKHTNSRMFRHNDLKSLERVLVKTQGQYVNRIVVVDGVYSMDGDIAPLREITEMAHCYGALVMVDDAHATGVIGVNGGGTPSHCGVQGQVDIVAGTFSKGLGAVGGFVAGSKLFIRYLSLACRAFMFSTAMPPAIAAAAIKSLDVMQSQPELHKKLWNNIRQFRDGLLSMKLNIGKAETAILPVILGDDLMVKDVCYELHRRGIYVNPVFFPAVPKKLARLRFSITNGFDGQDLSYALSVLEECLRGKGALDLEADGKQWSVPVQPSHDLVAELSGR